MVLTDRLVEALDRFAEAGQHAHLLLVLWKEYEQAVQEAEERPQALSIDGEFMSYSARPFYRHLVLFDSR